MSLLLLAQSEEPSGWVALLGILFQVGIFATPLLIGVFAGTITEKRHLKRLALREADLGDVMVTTLDTSLASRPAQGSELVIGEAVIANDYFKAFLAGFVKLVGGELRMYRRLMERARREATLRMIEHARSLGYNEVRNVRLETADIGGNSVVTAGTKKRKMVTVAIIASGTAVRSAG